MNDEAFYSQVAEEIQAKKMSPGLWTKAFAQAGGDTERTRAVYIKLRVAQLVSEKRRSEFQRFIKGKGYAVKGFAGLVFVGCIFMSVLMIGILASTFNDENAAADNIFYRLILIVFAIAFACAAIALLHKLKKKT